MFGLVGTTTKYLFAKYTVLSIWVDVTIPWHIMTMSPTGSNVSGNHGSQLQSTHVTIVLLQWYLSSIQVSENKHRWRLNVLSRTQSMTVSPQ